MLNLVGHKIQLIAGDIISEYSYARNTVATWPAGKIPVGSIGTIKLGEHKEYQIVWDNVEFNHNKIYEISTIDPQIYKLL
jgi:hypothetical protein